MTRRVLAFALVAVGTLLMSPANGVVATAGSPVDQGIIFSNGGRIVQVNSDGTGRKVLTRHGKVTVPGGRSPVVDRLPRISPEGVRILFSRYARPHYSPENRFPHRGQNMLLNLGTGKVREILPGNGRSRYDALAWLPGTDRILASKLTGRIRKASVVSVKLDGSDEVTILRFPGRRGSYPAGSSRFEAARIETSPDGARFLMTRIDAVNRRETALELVELETGKRKLIANHAHSGAWSPDGSQFVFVRNQAGQKVCEPDSSCTPSGDLFKADSDGTNMERLTRTRRDESSPSWSRDGGRIVFSGTIGHPRELVTAEIFSTRPDGSCLNGITNGSPASIDPVSTSGSVPDPATCGLTNRPALVEGHLNERMNGGLGRRLWLGPSSSQGLLSMDDEMGLLSIAVYGDCGTYRASECPPGVTLVTLPTCATVGSWSDTVAGLVRLGKKKRGVPIVVDSGRDGTWVLVFSGPQVTMISHRTVGDGKARPLNRRQLLSLVEELRPEGQSRGGVLPGFRLPSIEFRAARHMTRFVRRHSIRAAMKTFGLDRREVVEKLRFKRNAARLGVGKFECPASLSG